MNKKGFSLIELITVIAILGILISVLTPALLTSMEESREKADKVAIENLSTTLHVASQQSVIYKLAQGVVEDTKSDYLIIRYAVNDKTVVFSSCEPSNGRGESAEKVERLEQEIQDFINGKIEPIELKSEYYADRDYLFKLTFLDVDFKTNLEMSMVKRD